MAVSRLWAEEAGVTLIELMLVIVLVGVIMGATLTTFTQFERTSLANSRQNDAQDQVRVGLDNVARELRNLASPTDELPEAIVRADADDLVFQSVSSSQTRRVRYCLNTSDRRLWRQVQTTPFSDPSATSCPDSAWGSERTAVENVVNGERTVFSYNSTELTAITEVGASLWVDVNPGATPDEVALQTNVFLRNQNRSPIARFTAVVSGSTAILNGSQSDDPEGKALEYYWYDAAQAGNLCDPIPDEVPQTGCVGAGIVLNYVPPAFGTRQLKLVVRDPAGLTDEATAQSVCVPGGGVSC
jgi:prepilin-type N-terminal cleavage/methylation domain-containing protein